LPTVIITNGGRRNWRRKIILHQVQRSFVEKERRIVERNDQKAQRFRVLLGEIQEDNEKNPNPHRLGEEREKLFDKAARQLAGRRLRDGRIIVGCIGHDKTFVDIMEHIDRSMVVVGPKGYKIYHINVTGSKWIEDHLRTRPNVRVVSVQTEKERDGQLEGITINQIKECILDFIKN